MSDTLAHVRRHRGAIEELALRHGASRLRLFGSVIRGTDLPESDVDVLVRLDPDRGLLSIAALAVELERLLARRVDVVSEEGLPTEILDRVLREAQPL